MPGEPLQELACDFGEVAGRHFLIARGSILGIPLLLPHFRVPDGREDGSQRSRPSSANSAPLRGCSLTEGTQFTAASFGDFLRHWGVTPRVSSPSYPQSNGLAESAVKRVKHLLTKCGGKAESPAFVEGLLAYRATPRDGGLSPAHLVFGRAPRTRVPQLPEARVPQKSVEDHLAKTAKLGCRRQGPIRRDRQGPARLGQGRPCLRPERCGRQVAEEGHRRVSRQQAGL